MWQFVAGLFVGGTLGVIALALVVAARNADKIIGQACGEEETHL